MADVDNTIVGNIRTKMGKGPSRRARRAGLVPAVLYGHGIDPVHVDLPGHQVFLIVKDTANAVITVKYGDDEQMALVKDIQRHPVRRDILHVDLQVVRKGEKVEVEVPLNIVGEPAAGYMLAQEEFSLVVTAPAIAIPETIDVPVEGLPLGHIVRVEDLKLPEGVEVNEDLLQRDLVSVIEIEEIVEETGEDEEGEMSLEDAEAEVEEATSAD